MATVTEGKGNPMVPGILLCGKFAAITGEHSVMPYPSHKVDAGHCSAKFLYTWSGHFSAPTKANRKLCSMVVFTVLASMPSKKVGVAAKIVAEYRCTSDAIEKDSVGFG